MNKNRRDHRIKGGLASVRRIHSVKTSCKMISVELLEDRLLLSLTPALVRDINAGEHGSEPSSFRGVEQALYFSADDGNGRGLWKSDGTMDGTVFIGDLQFSSPTLLRDDLLFVRDGSLWKGDGTVEGSLLVKDLQPEGVPYGPSGLTLAEGQLFFVADDGIHGRELWKSDGTPEGTGLVKDINPGDDSSGVDGVFVPVGDTVYFSAYEPGHGVELWKSDGTEQGTVIVMDIWPGSESSLPGELTNVEGTLFFKAFHPTSGGELWKTDGTEAGTVLVRDIHPGNDESNIRYPVSVDGTLFFRADDGTHGIELWKSDGTEEGTVLVKDANSGPGHSFIKLHNVGGELFIEHQGSVWVSDGTDAGTVPFADTLPGITATQFGLPVKTGDTLLFVATDDEHGQELWKSDGTPEGTGLLKDILPGSGVGSDGQGSSIEHLTPVDGRLFFRANDGVHGDELWMSDGTVAGTIMVKNIRQDTYSSEPYYLSDRGGTLFFEAQDSLFDERSIWMSDGTTEGTVRFADTIGLPPDSVTMPVAVGDTWFFKGFDPTHGWELWKSDGTQTGTMMVKDIWPGGDGQYPNWSNPFGLTAVGDQLFFGADNGTHFGALWKSDGTPDGTQMVAAVGLASDDTLGTKDTLYFKSYDEVSGEELWMSDGTDAGTISVKDINPGPESSYPESFTLIGDTLFFTAFDGIRGTELWKTDGTTEGTMLVRDIGLANNDLLFGPYGLTAVNGTLFFSATDFVNGRGLWKSDGTAEGTVLVQDFGIDNPDTLRGGPIALKAVNDTLFFVANDRESGEEIWMSDGTEEGTVIVKDIMPGPDSSVPRDLTPSSGLLYFSADDGVHGDELWQTDGTTAGTVLVADIQPGNRSSGPANFTDVQGSLLFTAGDGRHGYELWRLAIPGDSNFDGIFDSSDLVTVFQAEKYEDGITNNATFAEGDWNGDGDFDTSDLVFAFQAGNYIAAATPLESDIAAAVDWLFAREDSLLKRRPFVA